MRAAWALWLAVNVLVGTLAACGGGWTSTDTSTTQDAVHAQMMVEELCADAATCPAAPVRALERMAICADSSRLAAHGAPVPDSGIACTPP